MAMPIGLRRLSLLNPGAVPWAWAINGVTSVLASALAVAVAITAGFTVATLAAAAFYLAALAHAVLGRWPDGIGSGDAETGTADPARPPVAPAVGHQRPSARA
jgi:hypothetical protein